MNISELEEHNWLPFEPPARIEKIPTKRVNGRTEMQLPWGEVVGHFKPEVIRQIAFWADEAWRMLKRNLGGPAPIEPLTVWVLNPQEYDALIEERKGPMSFACYDTDTQEAYVVHDGTGEIDLANLQHHIVHELTHAYMDLVFGLVGPPWFAEGLAEYFGMFYWNGQRLSPGAFESILAMDALTGLQESQLGPVLAITDHEVYGRNWERNTAVAWALIGHLASKGELASLIADVKDDKDLSNLVQHEAKIAAFWDEFFAPPPDLPEGQIIIR